MHTARLETVRAKCQLPPPVEVARGMMYLMLPTPSPCGQTDACENIAFPKLRLRAVII